MIKYTGFIRNVRFYSEESNYIVASIEVEEEQDILTMNGYMTNCNDYDKYEFFGEYVIHPKYGKQFKLDHYQVVLTNNHDEVIKYLSSPLFKGVGKVLATTIVDNLGEHALSLIKENPSILDNIKGMTFARKNAIVDVLKNNDYDHEVLQFFMGHGVSLKNLSIIQAVYKEKTLQVLQNNPYQMIEDIDGLGFKTVDELSLKIGGSIEDPNRIKAAIVYVIKDCGYRMGSTYVSKEDIISLLNKLVYGLDKNTFEEYLEELIEDGIVINKEERYYYHELYSSEIIISNFIKKLTNKPKEPQDEETINQVIDDFQKNENILYASKQREAIETFLKEPFMILTGGPGTGKTTIVKAMLKIYHQMFPEDQIGLVAPTGRAAKRLSSLSGINATTIHRLLKWDLHTNKFAMNIDNPLDIDVLVIDEFSMVDSLLLANLFQASKKVFKVLFIGDYHQLPSVGPGNILKDLMHTNVLKIELDEIFRQAKDSGIVQLSHRIVNDEFTDFDIFEKYNDVNFFELTKFDIVKNVKTIAKKALLEGYDSNDIQVLAPMYRGVAGIDALNDALQEVFNPDEGQDSYRIGKHSYRIGDKILQLKNRVDDDVFNGDIGILVDICRKDNFEYLEDKLIVDFDSNIIEYTSKDFNTFTLAYCMSIHKSQGNEFKIVILAVLKDYYIMLKRNLVYTGITRAKQSLFILGQKEAFLYSCNNKHDNNRKTTLVTLFNNEVSPYDFI